MKRQKNAQQLINHDRQIARYFEGVPPQERANADWCRRYLIEVAQHEPAFARSAAYDAAMEILHEAAQEQQLAHKISLAYHAAIAAGVVTEAEANRLLNDPTALQRKLAEVQASHPDWYWANDGGQLAASAFYESQEYEAGLAANPPLGLDPEPADDAERDDGQAQPDAAPHPAVSPSLERQISEGLELMRSDPARYWSDTHQARMSRLYEQQLTAQAAGPESAIPTEQRLSAVRRHAAQQAEPAAETNIPSTPAEETTS